MTLARYASISQQHGLVPIVEPEILTDGSHSKNQGGNTACLITCLPGAYRTQCDIVSDFAKTKYGKTRCV